MQNRMKTHPLSEAEISTLLDEQHVGRIATIGEDGFPYVVPVHYVVSAGKIYIHGLPKGAKIDNLLKNPKVGFEVDINEGYLYEEDKNACNTNTAYRSVIIRGQAAMVSDLDVKRRLLDLFVAKYSPQFVGRELPEASVKGTGLIEITPEQTTGKYYR